MHGRVRGAAVDGAQQASGAGLDDRHRLAAAAADVDVGPSATGPVPAGRPAPQLSGGHELVELGLRHRATEVAEVLRRQRQLGRGAAQLRAEHVGVGRVGDGGLDRPAEHRPRVVGEVVVQRVVAGDEDDQRLLLRPPGPPGLLPQRGERARVAGQHDGVQPGDVDAELQRVRRRHAEQVAGRQGPLQLAALLGQVAAAVGVHPAHEVVAAAVVQQAAGLLGHRLRAAPRPDERQRPGAALHEVGEQRGGVRGGRAAQRRPVLAGALGQRRLPQREGRAGPGRAVGGDRLDGRAHQPGRGRGGVGDRGRGQHEHRLRAVAAADAAQPAQHVPDVRPEDAAVGVALVDDHVGHPAQRARPLLVGRQDPAVQHVRVGDDPPRVPPDPVPLLARGCPRRRRPGAPTDRRAPPPTPAGRGPAPWSAPGRGRRRGGPRRAGSAPAAGRPATSPTPSRSPRRRAARRGRSCAASTWCRHGARDPALLEPVAQRRAHPRRPGQRAALPDRHVVDVGDRLLVLGGPASTEARRSAPGQQRGAPCAGRCRQARERPSSPRSGREGEPPDRVERRHPSTVTPRGNRRAAENLIHVIRATERPVTSAPL